MIISPLPEPVTKHNKPIFHDRERDWDTLRQQFSIKLCRRLMQMSYKTWFPPESIS